MNRNEKYSYVVLSFLVLIAGCFVFTKLYNSEIEDKKALNIQEINKKEFDFYMKDRANAILLIGVEGDFYSEKVKRFVIQYAKEKFLTDMVVYLNLESPKDLDKIIADYKGEENLKVPLLVSINNRKVSEVYNFKDENKINANRIDKFIERFYSNKPD